MWKLFKAKTLLSKSDSDFQFDTFEWLLKYFGGSHFYDDIQLVLPTDKFFPAEIRSPHDAAEFTFQRVKDYSGLTDWPVILEEQDADPNLLVAPTIAIQNNDISPAGTFRIDKNEKVRITYNPDIVSDPVKMVSVFSHELAHYLTATSPEPPPGGWENWEFATDTCAIFLGFGIFQANSAFGFQQYSTPDSIGWSTSGVGYLSQRERCFALAVFLKLKGINPEVAYPYCDRNVKSYLKFAFKELESDDRVEKLKDVCLVQQCT